MYRRWIIVLCLLVAFNAGSFLFWRWRKEHRYDRSIAAAAHKYGLSPALVKAVIRKESQFNASAVGSKGEIGLMQLMEEASLEWAASAHATNFSTRNLFDPGTNTMAGCYYLSRLMRRYGQTDNPVAYALADYNAGRGNVLRWMKGPAGTNCSRFLAQMNFPSTRNYVTDILGHWKKYQAELQ